MAIGIYGTIRPADVNINEIDVYWNYTPNRQTINNVIHKIEDASEVLSYVNLPEDDSVAEVGQENLLEGMYNLTLPASVFNQLGIYTIYVKPKMFRLMVRDCGVLSALPTVKGIVIDRNDLPSELQSNNAVQGYRIEYIDSDGNKIRNVVRYVVTSNRVIPINENVGGTSQKATRYTFNDSGSLVFLQVTPSSSSDIKPNITPYIGNPGDTMLISNTNFSPLMIEIEMVENTLDTIANIIAGEQIKDVQNGILTHYDENRIITKQFNVYQIKDDVSDVPLYEVREKRENIDNTINFNEVTGDIT